MLDLSAPFIPSPPHDCSLCPRLHDFLLEWRERESSWHNAPVAPFLPAQGVDAVRLLIVGLAPGLRGANRTGRPFTGDYAGDLLYATLKKYGFAKGDYQASPDDGLELEDVAIVNAVRCVPPQNKPVGAEINNCRRYLESFIHHLPSLQAIVTLGLVAHQSTLRALKQPVSRHIFGHGREYQLDKIRLFSSYHCSRYNTNTGRLSAAMFEDVFARIRVWLEQAAPSMKDDMEDSIEACMEDGMEVANG